MTPADTQHLRKSLPAFDAPAGGTYRLRDKSLGLAVGGYVTKAIDRSKGTVQSVLSFPGRDYDGDTINPAGGDWHSEFPANPLVNWTHGVPVGRGSVPELKSFDVDGEQLQLPVGVTRFFQSKADTKGLRLFQRDARGVPFAECTPDECLHAAESVARLVFDGIADGVSIEFKPDGVEGKAFWPTGQKSALLGRDEIHWEKWVGMGWAHALQCKNPNAAVIQDKAFRIAETGRFEGGAKVSPIIMKSFAAFRDRKPKYIRVERKAMPDVIDDAPEGVDTIDAPVDDKPAGGGMKPTPTAYMQAIQHLEDGAQALEDLLGGGALEHEKGIAGLEDHIEELRSLCSDLNAQASKMFPDAGFESATKPPAEDAGAEPEVETNDDGAVKNKAFPAGFPVRFRVAKNGTGYERVAAAVTDDDDEPDAATLKALSDETQSILAETRRERRKLDKNNRIKAANDRRARGY